EVLPSSAAAIYGGAAVGGVVNIVLKHEYTGAEIKVTQDNTFDTNAPIRTFDATYGTALEDGKTHVLLAAHYSEAEALLNRDRPELLQRGLDTINSNSPTFFSSGSPFSGGTTPNIASVSGNPLVLRPEYGGGSLGSRITYIPTGASGATAATALGAGLLADAGNYNYDLGETADGRRGLNGQALGAPTVKSALMTLRRAWGERLETFAAFSVNSNSSRTTLAPFSGVAIAVPATAPTNPFTEAVTINIVDPTRGVIESEALSKRVTAGFTVRLPYDWQGEADYTWSSSRLRYDGPMRNSARFSADIRSGVLNPFVDTLSNPLDLSSYLGRYGVNFPATLNDVGVRLAGPLGSLPAGAPTLTIGVEHRKEGFSNGRYYTSFANAPAQSSELLFPGQSQTANSIYLESSVPLVSALNEMPAVRKLDMQLAVRTEDFKVSTGTTYVVVGAGTPIAHSETSYRSTNFTVGLRYMPTDDITFRMSYGTAFMPPDYSQLLNPAVVMNNVGGQNATQTVIDPRRGNTPVSVNYISGGNPDLEPEETKNWNVGLIWQPQWLPGLRANVEWYRFDQTNVPVTPTAQRIVDSESTYPDRVVRGTPAANDPYGVGAITLVDYSLIPANKARTDGVDVSLGYRLETDRWGAFDFNAGATRVLHFEQERVFGASLQDFLNQVNNGGPLKLRGNASLGWTLKAWNLGWSTNYYGSYPQYAGPGNTYIQAQGGSSIPSQIYHSVFAGYHFDPEPGARLQMLSGTSIEFGIRNLFDETPPFDAYPGNLNNYYSPFGDPRLRTYWLSLAKTF
ncbi:TonB-dependent receptor domain-containing protein, partial [Steroidobacter sp.]|uniref:TonB-dependent receptor domain-containing protein n=1 Tax=Steroidobacter sp. TaxID=1978227 RepID=UPI001A47863E